MINDNSIMLQTLRVKTDHTIELVSKELNHFGVIAGLFRQIGGHTLPVKMFGLGQKVLSHLA